MAFFNTRTLFDPKMLFLTAFEACHTRTAKLKLSCLLRLSYFNFGICTAAGSSLRRTRMPMLTELDLVEARGLPRHISPSEIAQRQIQMVYQEKTDDSDGPHSSFFVGMRRAVSCQMLGAVSHRNTAGVQRFSDGSVAAQAPRPQMPPASKINHKARGLGVAPSGEPIITTSGQVMCKALIRQKPANLLSEVEAEMEVSQDPVEKTDSSKGVGMRRAVSCQYYSQMLGATSHRNVDTVGVETQSFSSGRVQSPRPQMPLVSKINHKTRGLGFFCADDQLPLSSKLFNELANVEPLIQLCLLPLQPQLLPHHASLRC